MAASRKKTKPTPTRWYAGDAPFEDLSASEQLAHEIVQEYRDLAPSVERIMVAELTEPQRHRALELFQTSLGDLGDPNRDPRNAIAAVGVV